MTTYHDPRAELDYSQFQEVDTRLENHTGYLAAPVVARRGTIDADYIGVLPRESFAPGEREAFQSVRDRLDRALQVAGVVPSTPQEYQTPDSYERSLVSVLADHTKNYTKADCISTSAERFERMRDGMKDATGALQKPGIIDEALAEPYRKGVMKEVKLVDRTGREIKEFVGPKSVWMNPLKSPVTVSPIYIDDVPQRV